MNRQAQQVILKMLSAEELNKLYPMESYWDTTTLKYTDACCASRTPFKPSLVCTRKPNHDGPHVAHAGPNVSDSSAIAGWVDEPQGD